MFFKKVHKVLRSRYFWGVLGFQIQKRLNVSKRPIGTINMIFSFRGEQCKFCCLFIIFVVQ